MALNLNEPTEKPNKEFYGRNVDQMPLLVAEGRVPMSVAGLMNKRLHYERQDWRDNYFDTGDGVAYHPDGKRFKVVLDAQPLREMTGESQLNAGALVLTDGVYESLEGQEFTRKELEKITGRNLSPDEVKAHPVWQALARGDNDLLQAYTDATFAEMGERWSYEDGMGVYLGDAQKSPIMRSWFVNWLSLGSNASGGSDLGNASGRLVGVAPEAQGASTVKPLEHRVRAAINSGQAFEHDGTLYVPVKDERVAIQK